MSKGGCDTLLRPYPGKSPLPEDVAIVGVAWDLPRYIKLSHKERLRLLLLPEAVITLTRDWKEVLRVPVAEVPFFRVDGKYLEVRPAVPVRAARVDAPVWVRVVYSIDVERKKEDL